MVTEKVKFALCLTPEARIVIEENYQADKYKSQSEYIDKAVLITERSGFVMKRKTAGADMKFSRSPQRGNRM